MRITEKENYVFVQVLSKYLDKRAELHLYGSFVDENASGGSIDLLLVVATDEKAGELEGQKASIEREIETLIEEDDDVSLLIASEAKSKDDEQIQALLPGSVFLYRW